MPIITLPETGYLRTSHLLGNPKADPPVPGLFPFGKTTLWAKVKAGTFPAPIKPFGPRITVWRVETIREYIANLNSQERAVLEAISTASVKAVAVGSRLGRKPHQGGRECK